MSRESDIDAILKAIPYLPGLPMQERGRAFDNYADDQVHGMRAAVDEIGHRDVDPEWEAEIKNIRDADHLLELIFSLPAPIRSAGRIFPLTGAELEDPALELFHHMNDHDMLRGR